MSSSGPETGAAFSCKQTDTPVMVCLFALIDSQTCVYVRSVFICGLAALIV